MDPLGPGGSRLYRRAVFDHRTDSDVLAPIETAADDAILLLDGIFLHRPEVLGYWDLSLFLDAPFEVTVARAAARDHRSSEVNAIENRRYVEGQQLYLRTCAPRDAATIVIDNEHLPAPNIARQT